MNKLFSLLGFCCIFLFVQCKPTQDVERFSVYRFPEHNRGYQRNSQKNYITELIIDEKTECVTYLVFPKETAPHTHMLIMRYHNASNNLGSYTNNDGAIYLSTYNIYILEMTSGELYDCSYAGTKYDVGLSVETLHRKGHWVINAYAFNRLEKKKANKIFNTKDYREYIYMGDSIKKEDIHWSNPESMDCISFFHAYPEGKLYPPPFPSPLIKVKKFSYKDFSNKYIVKNPSKQLYPALEALFTGKPMTEVDSLLKVGYGELNRDYWKLE